MATPATVTREEVLDALRVVEDPELGMDVVELGLVYDAEVDGAHVKVTFSLTSMGCPVGPMIQEQIVETVEALAGVEQCEPDLVWDPPWTPERMSEDAKFILGFG
jgi:metal-sulfur cluster biosynthetic enzyme